MVYNPEGQPGLGVETVLCNPVIVESSADEELFEEGCLSFPEIYADVMVRHSTARARGLHTPHKYTLIRDVPGTLRRHSTHEGFFARCREQPLTLARAAHQPWLQRPTSVEISYQDIRGAKKRMRLGGFQARIFQHEFDHLQGVLFCDRMAPECVGVG